MIETSVFGFIDLEVTDTINHVANDNMQKVETAILGRKAKQTPKTDPTASGNATSFIATIEQDEDGVITATKKTIPTASSGVLGVIALGYTTSGKNYPVSVDSNGKAYVYVPWSDTTYSDATTTTHGLMSATDKAKLNGIANGATANIGTITGITMNGASKGTSGNVDLGTVLTSHQSLASCLKTSGNQSASGVQSFTNTTDSSSTGNGAVVISGGLGVAKNIRASKVYNAVWNDYAECCKSYDEEPGRCLFASEDGFMLRTDKRLMPACRIVSDTYGACMGETEDAKTPVAVAGRVLAYVSGKVRVGDTVCSGPNGTVCKMSRREIRKYPDRVVGVVAEIPTYDKWKCGVDGKQSVNVNGRVWLFVR